MSERILITGSSSFMGVALARHLKKHKPSAQLFGICRKLPSIQKNVFACDLTVKNNFKKVYQQILPDTIVHLVGGRYNSDLEIYNANFLTARNILKTLEELDKKSVRVILIGSAAEYGQPARSQLVKENSSVKNLSWYGLVKHMQTDLGLNYARKGFDVVIARVFNITGWGVGGHLAAGVLANKVAAIENKKSKPVLIEPYLSSRRDYLDIQDVCSALTCLIDKGKRGEVYNVCAQKGVSFRQIYAELIKHSSVRNIVLQNKPTDEVSFHVVGSNKKLKSLGWSPMISLKQSLQEMLEYHRQLGK